MNKARHKVVGPGACWLVLLLLLVSCRTLPDLPEVNLSEPGWTMKQGQAVWRRDRNSPEIAGEVLFATRSGRTLLQLTKNPLPFVTAQTSGDQWQVEFVPQRRRFKGKGVPTERLLWIHLARALSGTPPPASLKFTQSRTNGFALDNAATGESITGFLNE